MNLMRPELLSLAMIWEGARHNAFTDLARYRGRWLCTFREGTSHALCPGKIRVLASRDGVSWESAALIARRGVDLRDPKFAPAPGGKFDLVMGASPLKAGRYTGRTTLAARSNDGLIWTAPTPVTPEGDWLWRVERSGACSYGVSYRLPAKRRWTVSLLESPDGLSYRELCPLGVPGLPNEATLRFRGREAIVLVRREAGPGHAWIGTSLPPYASWQWRQTRERVGGPNFIVLADGTLVAAARTVRRGKPHVAVCGMTEDSLIPLLELPAGGDCGYPGMVCRRGVLWISYYSSHEGKSRIYLARVRLAPA